MVDAIKMKFKEEVNDFHAYKQMERAALNAGDRFAGLWLMKIAADEYSHAKWMRHYLKERNMFSKELEELWEHMDEKMDG